MRTTLAPRTWKICTDTKMLEIYNEVLEEARGIGYSFKNPRLYTFKSVNSFGRCITKLDESVIGLNEEYLSNPENSRSTCVHEIAHAILPKHHHDYVWKEAGNKIGYKWGIAVSRCSTEEEKGVVLPKKDVGAKYIIGCPECNAKWEYKRMAKVVQYPKLYRCGKCKSSLIRLK